MATEKPRFRNDLVSQPVDEGGAQYVDVSDPESGSAFRFYDVEYSIACAMDGTRDLASLCAWTQSELGIDTSAEELAGVIGTLKDLGYLETVAPTQTPVVSAPAPMPANDIDRPPPGSDEDMSFDGLIEAKPTKRNIPIPPPHNAPRPTPISKPASPAAKPPPPAAAAEHEVVEMVVGYEGESVDLGAKVSLDEVKAAIRASKVIEVPTIPEAVHELQTARARSEPALPIGLDDAVPGSVEAPSAEAIDLPSAPPMVRPIDPTHLPQPFGNRKRSNITLMVAAAAIFFGGIGAVVYFFLLDRSGASGEVVSIGPDSGTGGDEDTPPSSNDKIPSLPTARLSKSESVTVDVKVNQSGEVEWTATEGEQAEIGAVLLKLKGVKRWESKLSAAQQRLDHYSEKLKKAKASSSSSSVASATRKVAEKQGLVDAAEASMKDLVVKAPVAGTVSLLASVGDKVKADQPVVRLGGGSSGLVASFDVGEQVAGYSTDDSCVVAAKDNAAQRFDCVVTKVEGATVVVRVSDAQAAEDMEVVLSPKEAPGGAAPPGTPAPASAPSGDKIKGKKSAAAPEDEEELVFDEDEVKD